MRGMKYTVSWHAAKGDRAALKEKATAVASGYDKVLERAGAKLMTDTCSAISQASPPGTKVAAFDSAKQSHYLPAMMNIMPNCGPSTAR